MYHVKVYITYKPSILDPQGEAVKTALHRLDYQNVETVTVGKYFEIDIKDDGRSIEDEVEKMCDELLANVNMETYRYEIESVTQTAED
ncbi:phosphoribosylformylglycinamidine synthase subunit PurS [Paucilactobacillus suebicus]|uniref:Phosphoribosylformylglycinamidine synthase subunit PurS n=1 Tax=Paucilactobacillus suebicus DSM 5007 = KCTC 3549 TaxID=1423807 RepID=A0A0R1W5R4_9LACO|nr:phosphoribosylformylglycinamidine synthase subunit PurS [Paucilactobacillus suebicus]KRM12951.1 phosphoribosylformylglycinamidine (FGAM) synthase, PurS component [Paucilactobacillus suebicus DSM 5007 = KCTC 3549]